MRALVFVSLMMLLGCDAAEYQKRMDIQRARMKIFDEESKWLGKPLEQAVVKVKTEEFPGWPFEVFLRLPKGISASVAGEKEFGILQYQGFLVFRYPGESESYSVMVAAAKKAGEEKKEKGKEEGWPRYDAASFRDNTRYAVDVHFRTAFLVNMKYPEPFTPTRKPIEVPSVGTEKRESLAYDFYTWDGIPSVKDKEPVTFYFYHLQAADRHVGVIFQIPASKKDDSTEMRKMELSMRTLAIGESVSSRRAEYERLYRK